MATINLTCPQCGQIDSVRKVSAIVSDGTSSSWYSGYGDGIGYSAHGMMVMDEVMTFTGSSQTELSHLLSPPIRPSERSLFGIFLVMLLIGLLGLISTTCGFIGIFATEPGALGNYTTELGAGGMYIFGILCLSLGVLVLIILLRNSKDEKIRVEREMPAWINAIYRWQQLYYCFRCDGVYPPNLNYIVPAQYMMEYLYQI